ncbi:MAG: hypothetical protein ABGW97_15990 [Christiangramia sp.]|uniref:terminase gpP N-terminus-related DNA-binding protein n=1 Tax=Christiangramia sp. TaxID=1931228 RepID=UPI0032424D47
MAKGRMTSVERDYLISQGGELYSKGFTPQSISDLLKVGLKTIYKWRDENDWEKQKELNTIRPSEIKKMILEYVVAIKKGEVPPYKADDLAKVAAAFDRLNDSRKRAVYTMESFDEFSGSMMTKAGKAKGKRREELLDLLKEIRVHFDKHITDLLKND